MFRTSLCAATLLLSLGAQAGSPVISDGISEMSVEEARAEIAGLGAEMRGRVVSDGNALVAMLANALTDRRIEAAARAAGLADHPDVKARIAKLTQGAIIKRYLDDEMARIEAAAPDFTARARELYAADSKGYMEPEAIRVAHILLSVDPEDERHNDAKGQERAAKAMEELKAGADFEEMVRKYSGDRQSSKSKGLLPGWQPRGSLAPPFEEAAYGLKPGETSGIVRSRFGYHIIKLIEHRPARRQSFDEVQGPILAKVRNAYLQEQRAALLARFAGKEPVKVDDELMAALGLKR